MSSPKVSVVIPTYNRASCISDAINSVLRQTYRNFELIVVDDGSTDDTSSVLAKFGDQIRVIRQPNGGVSVARNTGINAAHGEWIALLDSDDVWVPEKLEVQVHDVEAHPEAVAHMTDASIVGYGEDPISCFQLRNCREEYRRKPLRHQPLIDALTVQFFTSTWMLHRTTLLKSGLFPTNVQLWEDLDVLLNIALEGPFVVNVQPGTLMRRVASETETVSDRHLKKRVRSLEDACSVYSNLLLKRALAGVERRAIQRELSGAHYELSAVLAGQGERRRARAALMQSVKVSPHPRSILRASIIFICGHQIWNKISSRLKKKEAGFRRSEQDAVTQKT